jgi:hypothetical protein
MSDELSSVSALAKKLRNLESEHPLASIAANFNPVYGAASSAAAIADPDAPWWEKALSAPGLVPGLGGASKATVLLAARLRKHPELLKQLPKFIDPLTGKKMAELSDHTSKVDKQILELTEAMHPTGFAPANSLEDVYQHPDLFNAEPYLKDVTIMRGVDDPKNAGEYSGIIGRHGKNPIPGFIGYRKLPDSQSQFSMDLFDNTVRHETQHAVDDAASLLGNSDGARVQPWDWGDYWTRPSEVRARVSAIRSKFSPKSRAYYPFDQMMNDEIARLKSLRDLGADPYEAMPSDWDQLLMEKYGKKLSDFE